MRQQESQEKKQSCSPLSFAAFFFMVGTPLVCPQQMRGTPTTGNESNGPVSLSVTPRSRHFGSRLTSLCDSVSRQPVRRAPTFQRGNSRFFLCNVSPSEIGSSVARPCPNCVGLQFGQHCFVDSDIRGLRRARPKHCACPVLQCRRPSILSQ